MIECGAGRGELNALDRIVDVPVSLLAFYRERLGCERFRCV